MRLLNFLMTLNLIPPCFIELENPERLKTTFLKKEYSYPIGLNSGIDYDGNVKFFC